MNFCRYASSGAEEPSGPPPFGSFFSYRHRTARKTLRKALYFLTKAVFIAFRLVKLEEPDGFVCHSALFSGYRVFGLTDVEEGLS